MIIQDQDMELTLNKSLSMEVDNREFLCLLENFYESNMRYMSNKTISYKDESITTVGELFGNRYMSMYKYNSNKNKNIRNYSSGIVSLHEIGDDNERYKKYREDLLG